MLWCNLINALLPPHCFDQQWTSATCFSLFQLLLLLLRKNPPSCSSVAGPAEKTASWKASSPQSYFLQNGSYDFLQICPWNVPVNISPGCNAGGLMNRLKRQIWGTRDNELGVCFPKWNRILKPIICLCWSTSGDVLSLGTFTQVLGCTSNPQECLNLSAEPHSSRRFPAEPEWQTCSQHPLRWCITAFKVIIWFMCSHSTGNSESGHLFSLGLYSSLSLVRH